MIEASWGAILSFVVLVAMDVVFLWLHFSRRGQEMTDAAFDKAEQYGDSADAAVGKFVRNVEDELPAVIDKVKSAVKR